MCVARNFWDPSEGLLGLFGRIGHWRASGHTRNCATPTEPDAVCTADTIDSSVQGASKTSLTVVPLLTFWLLRSKIPPGENRLMLVLKRRFLEQKDFEVFQLSPTFRLCDRVSIRRDIPFSKMKEIVVKKKTLKNCFSKYRQRVGIALSIFSL